MPIQENDESVAVTLWTLNTIEDMDALRDAVAVLGLNCGVYRVPLHEDPAQRGRLEIHDTRVRTMPTFKVEQFGTVVRTVKMGNQLISIAVVDAAAS